MKYGCPVKVEGIIAQMAGYPGDKDDGECAYHASGPIESATKDQVFYRMDDSPGMSGSGIWCRDDTGDPFLFAVASFGSDITNGGSFLNAARCAMIKSWIESGS